MSEKTTEILAYAAKYHEKKCVLCKKEFLPEKSNCALCKKCLKIMKKKYNKTGSITL